MSDFLSDFVLYVSMCHTELSELALNLLSY